MKKSHYVTKYDYISYYTKQPNMWFYTNSEINATVQLQKEKNAKLSKNIEFYDEDEYEDHESHEFDLYEHWKELKYNDELNQLSENDSNLISGRLLDEQAKIDIKKYAYDNIFLSHDVIIYDFDQQKCNLAENAKITYDLIENNEQLILFQPAFIDRIKKIATKADAIIKNGNDIYLIETKGTTSCTLKHFLDLLFQKRIIEYCLSNFQFQFSYFLCVVKYEELDALKVSFIFSDTINFSKSSPSLDKKKYDHKEIQDRKIGIRQNDDETNYIDDVLEGIGVEKKLVLNVINEFDYVINQLWEHKNKMEINFQNGNYDRPNFFIPHYNDKGDFQPTLLWLDLRAIYAAEGYELFKYSGNIMNQSGASIDKFYELKQQESHIEWDKFFRYPGEFKDYFKNLFFTNKKEFLVDKMKFKEYWSQIKAKRVYFDFETINPAFRVLDHSLPFAQIVTQCSVIVDNGANDHCFECRNLMIDPCKYNVDFLKEIIDSLYHGNDYSYIVYNKSFECSRLNEMRQYLRNDSNYHYKIDVIINNIIDLADYFKMSLKEGYTLFFKELGGFYSIKKILPLIQKYRPNIFERVGCLDYKTLNIQNGSICQNKSLMRFYNFAREYIDDCEWNEIEKDSKIYCENDVRAMIAVFEFLEDIKNNDFVI